MLIYLFVIVFLKEFLKCFEELGDTAQKSEQYFRLYSQMTYVIQRNTKEECFQELVPKYPELIREWCTLDSNEAQLYSSLRQRQDGAADDPAAAAAALPVLAEYNAIWEENQRKIEALQRISAKLTEENSHLARAEAELDAELESVTSDTTQMIESIV